MTIDYNGTQAQVIDNTQPYQVKIEVDGLEQWVSRDYLGIKPD